MTNYKGYRIYNNITLRKKVYPPALSHRYVIEEEGNPIFVRTFRDNNTASLAMPR
ncbi:MAG TPA: hypothetical protein VEH06_09560 [Candidatus Bathyarchaeia archaeon]|nr:hypothetical protein [Candidatus Bathyarchaeia archaeon]